MTEQQGSALTQRLEHLEQEVRQCRRESHWWRLVGSGAVVVLVAVLLVGATGGKVAEEIRARAFVVVDHKGEVRARLYYKADMPDRTALEMSGGKEGGIISLYIEKLHEYHYAGLHLSKAGQSAGVSCRK